MNTNKMLRLLLIVAGVGMIACSQQKKITSTVFYPAPSPDSVAKIFLKGLVSKDSVDFGSAFSPDGQSFYFARSANRKSSIYVTHYIRGQWSDPEKLPFNNDRYSSADPAFSPTGQLYFISNRPKDKNDTIPDYDIWFVSPLANGGWSEPENVHAINSDQDEFYISFSKKGALYFSSSRPGGYGEEDIYMSRKVGATYTTPVNAGKSINSEKSEYDPCISANEDIIIFASSGRADALGKADLYVSMLSAEGTWQKAKTMGKHINTLTREYCPYWTPDLRYFFYSSEGDIKWIDAGFVKNKIAGLF